MPVAATGQPTTQEPRVCLRLPSTPEPVPKGADLFDEAGAPERTEYGGAEGGRGLGGYPQPGSISTPPQSPAASTSFRFHQMAVEPPRTRSRSRSGYYQQYSSGNGNGITSTGLMGSNHHPNQQQHLHFQQLGAGCAPLGAAGGHTENQPGSHASAGIQRFSSVPEAHPIPAPGNPPPPPPLPPRPQLASYLTMAVWSCTAENSNTKTRASFLGFISAGFKRKASGFWNGPFLMAFQAFSWVDVVHKYS